MTTTPSSTHRPAAEAAEAGALSLFRGPFTAGRPVVYVHSAEERRVASLLRAAAGAFFPTPVPVFTWSLTRGLSDEGGAQGPTEAAAPRGVLDFIAGHAGAAIFHLQDFHDALREPDVRRRLRELAAECDGTGKFVVISSAVRFIPEEIARDVVLVELPLPDPTELTALLHAELTDAEGVGDDLLAEMAQALRGLTIEEARHALRRARAETGGLGHDAVPVLLDEKRLVINQSGLIESLATDTSIEDVGGLDTLRKWLVDRRKLFVERESVDAEIVPKGVLVMGISGCGKSLSVKAIASCFDLPLYRIDLTAVFSGGQGNAEAAFVRACRLLEQVSPAVVWFDEIEMGVSTQGNDASGEINRIFAFFLTWMQEKPRGLFVAATANRIDLLPAEMIRKGRFDEVFFVDLPQPNERAEIFRIHLTRRGIDAAGYDLGRLMRFTEGWSGAEVEQCVVSALTTARLESRELADQDLLTAATRVVPLARTMKEQIDHIRNWAYDRAVPARPDELAANR